MRATSSRMRGPDAVSAAREFDRLTVVVQAITHIAKQEYDQAANALRRCYVFWPNEPIFQNVERECNVWWNARKEVQRDG